MPTLRALLFPETRPAEFSRAYDVYDFTDVGFVSSGAEAEKEVEKEDLLEYLKTL